MTQGDPLSTTIFNIVVEAVVKLVLLEVYGPQEVQHGLVWAAGEHNIVIYADNAAYQATTPSGYRQF